MAAVGSVKIVVVFDGTTPQVDITAEVSAFGKTLSATFPWQDLGLSSGATAQIQTMLTAVRDAAIAKCRTELTVV